LKQLKSSSQFATYTTFITGLFTDAAATVKLQFTS